MKTMRAGVLVLAPLLAKFGKARVSLPGGCSIGARPVNLHLEALKKLGAKINVKNGYIDASAPKGLSGANIKFPLISVGATESIIIAAVLAKGITKISNAAIEPEIIDLINFLNKCGADIKYNSKRKIIIKGVKFLYPVRHRIIPDRIEAATYAIAALITNGKLLVKKVNNEHLENIFNVLKKIGANIKIFKDSFVIFRKHQLKPFKIITKPYPGFPTDMQAQFMALATQIKGSSVINEEIFENRFLHVSELMRMGADIEIKKSWGFVPHTPSDAWCFLPECRVACHHDSPVRQEEEGEADGVAGFVATEVALIGTEDIEVARTTMQHNRTSSIHWSLRVAGVGVVAATSGVLARFPLLLPVRNSFASYGASAVARTSDRGRVAEAINQYRSGGVSIRVSKETFLPLNVQPVFSF